MNKMRLIGNQRIKKLVLVILVIVAILVLVYEGSINNNKHKEKVNEANQEEVINPTEIQENINNEAENVNINEGISQRENDVYNEAYTLFFSKEYKNAISKSNELIDEFPNSYMGYNLRGISKAYDGDYEGAMNDIDKSLEIDKNYGYARFNKALTYELYGEMNHALEWYNKALEIEEYVWSYYGISSIYGRRGDVDNTVIYLKKAIKMDESVKNIAKEEQDFNPVKDSKKFQEIVYN